MLKQNVGPLDRVTRTFLGILLIVTRYFFQIGGIAGNALILWGTVWICKGLLGYCFLYGIFNWSTKRDRE